MVCKYPVPEWGQVGKNWGSTNGYLFILFMNTYLLNQTCLGPAIGFGVTTLALCDVVYSVPHATFKTPFMQLGFCAEGCSSLLFPRIMGPSRANEMLVSDLKFFGLLDIG
jgi:hypothetical protein